MMSSCLYASTVEGVLRSLTQPVSVSVHLALCGYELRARGVFSLFIYTKAVNHRLQTPSKRAGDYRRDPIVDVAYTCRVSSYVYN